MGRPFLIELDCSDSNNGFFTCCSCETHIAIRKNYYYSWTPGDEGMGVSFNEIVNVEVDAQLRRIGPHLVADIHCKKCNDHLGWKYAEAEAGDPQFYAGKFLLKREKLQMRGGGRQNHITEA